MLGNARVRGAAFFIIRSPWSQSDRASKVPTTVPRKHNVLGKGLESRFGLSLHVSAAVSSRQAKVDMRAASGVPETKHRKTTTANLHIASA